MTTPRASIWPISSPIEPEWTISQLLDYLSEDAHLDGAGLASAGLGAGRPDADLRSSLMRIEAAASELVGAPAWRGEPSAIALVRSLAALRLRAPALGALWIGELLAPSGLRRSEGAPRDAAPDSLLLVR